MGKAKDIFSKIINKYTIVIIAFLLFLFLGEKHNAVQRIQYKQKIKTGQNKYKPKKCTTPFRR